MTLFEQGVAALEAADHAGAIAAFTAYLAACPEDADGWYNLGCAHFEAGAAGAATAAWQRVLELPAAGLSQAIFEAAETLLEAKLPREAAELYQSLSQDPELRVHASLRLSWCEHHLGRNQAALATLDRALAAEPRNLALKLQQVFLLPHVYDSSESMRWWRQHLLDTLAELEAWLGQPEQLTLGPVRLPSPCFDLMSQGEDEKELLQRISAVWRRLFVPPQPVAAPRRPGRPRLGIVTVSAFNHSTMHYFLGMLEALAGQQELETGLFYFGERQDHYTAYVQGLMNHFEQLPMTLAAGQQALTAWQPDVLFYLDIGQEALLYTLAHLRLAPVQCVSAGVPITTGIATMDYYLSSRWFERPDAAADYSEALICLEEPMVRMLPPAVNQPLLGRDAFGLPAAAHLYIFPHSLIRVDPELDGMLARILAGDALAEIVFISDKDGLLAEQVIARFGRRHAAYLPRLRFLPQMDQADFLNVVACCDVALDSLRLGGGNVSFQCFWVGTPIVHCPSRFLRCRIAAGLYRLAGREDWIAADWDDYVEKALRLGTQPALRAELSASLVAAREQIFNRSDGVEAMFGWFLRWATSA